MSLAEQLEGWTKGLERGDAECAVACLIAAVEGWPWESEKAATADELFNEDFRPAVARMRRDLERQALTPHLLANVDTYWFDAHDIATMLVVDAKAAAALWREQISSLGREFSWRFGLIPNYSVEEISALASFAVSRATAVCSLTWGMRWPGGLRYRRQRWDWPLKVALLTGQEQSRLQAAFVDSTRGVHGRLLDVMDAHKAEESCDLLLVDAANREHGARYRASAVLMFDASPQLTLAQVEEIATRYRADTVALVFAPPERILRAILDEISHNLPLDVALHRACSSFSGIRPPVVFGSRGFLAKTFLTMGVTAQVLRAMEQRPALRGRIAEIDHQLDTFRFDSELDGASKAADVARSSLAGGGAERPRRHLRSETTVLFPSGPEVAPAERREAVETEAGSNHGFLSGALNLVHLWIDAPTTERVDGGVPFDERDIRWSKLTDSVSLHIAVSVNGARVLSALDRLEWQILSRYARGVGVRAGFDAPRFAVPREAFEAWLGQELQELHEQPHRPVRRSNAQEIVLRRGGGSTAAVFPLLVPRDSGATKLTGRIMIYQGNRLLQTATLTGPVLDSEQWWQTRQEKTSGSGIEILPEAVIREDLDDADERRQFDAAYVVNHNEEDQGKASALVDDELCDIDFSDDGQAAEIIGAQLVQLADSPETFDSIDSEAFAALLRQLALHGVVLRRTLVKDTPLEDRLEAGLPLERIQVTSAKPEAFLPLEFIYEGDGPDHGAPLCPNAAAAFEHEMDSYGGPARTPGCLAQCPHQRASSHVCPFRFWGLTKVIEREMFNRKRAPRDTDFRLETPQPLPGRTVFPPPRAGLMASSSDAWSKEPGNRRQLYLALLESAGTVSDAETWDHWRAAIGTAKPTVLVVVPHHKGVGGNEFLEINDGTVPHEHHLFSGQVRADTIKLGRGPVLIILMGCETASLKRPYTSFPASFRQEGADVVICTLSDVLGRHAGPAAADLVKRMAHCWQTNDALTLAELLRRSRVHFASQGNPIAFTLLAYGDADWVFGKL